MATNTTEQPGLGPGDGPYTNPSLQANLFFRVFLGILANICCWVPMKLLWSNGEFAAAVFCLTTMVLNVFYSVNAMIWPDENTAKWWLGHGWCDMQVYLFYALDTLYTACVFEIMRQLADKVALSRVTSLSRAERRRRHLVSGLVIFPIPLLQVIMTWFVQSQRYSIGPLIGCLANYDSTLPYLITFVIPPPILTLGAAIFAALTWKRFRDVDRNNRNLLSSSGNEMAIRQARVRRKLYFLTLAILIPYSVVQFLFLASNITSQVSWSRPYNYDQIHYNPPPNQWTGSSPNAWNRITFILTDELDFASQNMNYTPILTVIPLFVSFGATKEAINVYRRYLLKLGLGRIWPRLEEEYDPDISTSGTTRAAWSLKMPSILRRCVYSAILPLQMALAFD
ncbi:pheromone receptor [Thozetella sp. PMI_491]|nr:pheromone receptor [Thozetella sp. PMI_491]